MILYLPGEPVSLWYWRASLIAASMTSAPPHSNLTVERSPGRQLGQQVGKLHGLRVGAVHRRRKRERVELLPDRLDHPAVVVPDRDHVDARDRVEIALALDVPVKHAVGAGHHERLLGPFGHLVAHEDLPEEGFVGGLSLVDQVGEDCWWSVVVGRHVFE